MNQPENTNPIEEDTEGHAASSRHADAEVAEGDDDTQGHRFSSSDRNIKDEIEPVSWEGDDDVEGHQKIFPAGAEPAEGDEIEGGMRRRRR